MRQTIGNALKGTIRFAVTGAILAAIVWKLDLGSAMKAITGISPVAILCVFALLLLQGLIAARRLSLIVALFGERIGLGKSFRITLESIFFSQTFVSVLGGDALRIWRVRRHGLSLEAATSVIALDRGLGIIVNHLLLLAILPWLFYLIVDDVVRLALIVLAAAGIAGMALIVLLGWLRERSAANLPSPQWRTSRIVSVVVEIGTVGRHFVTHVRSLGQPSVLSLLIVGANCVVFFVILWGMGVELSTAVNCALFVPAILEIAMLPISIAGWGVREGVAIVAFGAIGLPADTALGCSVVFGLLTAAVSLIGGMLWMFEPQELRCFGSQRL